MFGYLVKYSVGLAPFANASRGKHWEEAWHRAMYLGLALKAEGWMSYLPGTAWPVRRGGATSPCKETRAQQRSPIKGHRNEKETGQGFYKRGLLALSQASWRLRNRLRNIRGLYPEEVLVDLEKYLFAWDGHWKTKQVMHEAEEHGERSGHRITKWPQDQRWDHVAPGAPFGLPDLKDVGPL